MANVTLESLAKRVEALEAQLRKKDWRRTIGMYADNEFMQKVIQEGQKIREADRKAGRKRKSDDDAR